MTLKFPEELLSAYLDDELPPTERARVEQHLATSEADTVLRLAIANAVSLQATDRQADRTSPPPAICIPGFHAEANKTPFVALNYRKRG